MYGVKQQGAELLETQHLLGMGWSATTNNTPYTAVQRTTKARSMLHSMKHFISCSQNLTGMHLNRRDFPYQSHLTQYVEIVMQHAGSTV